MQRKNIIIYVKEKVFVGVNGHNIKNILPMYLVGSMGYDDNRDICTVGTAICSAERVVSATGIDDDVIILYEDKV